MTVEVPRELAMHANVHVRMHAMPCSAFDNLHTHTSSVRSPIARGPSSLAARK